MKPGLAPILLGGLFGITFLAGAVIFAATLDGDGGSAAFPATPRYSGRPTPAQLIGTWSSNRLSTITYRDRFTGGYAPPSGSLFSYQIAANGTFEFSGLMQSPLYNCTITIFRWQRGTLEAQGDRLTFAPREGRVQYKDTCRCIAETDRVAVDDPSSYVFKIEAEEGRDILVLKKASGEDWGKFNRR